MNINELSVERQNALNKLKKSSSWIIIQNLCKDIIDGECDLEKVNESLPDKEFKIEYSARKKAKKMFTDVFGKVDNLGTFMEKNTKDYS